MKHHLLIIETERGIAFEWYEEEYVERSLKKAVREFIQLPYHRKLAITSKLGYKEFRNNSEKEYEFDTRFMKHVKETGQVESLIDLTYYSEWLKSKRQVLFQDQAAARELAYQLFGDTTPRFLEALKQGIPADSITGRVEIATRYHCYVHEICEFEKCDEKNCRCNQFEVAILLPEIKEETQEEIWDAMFKNWSDASISDEVGKDVLSYLKSKFKITRI